MILAKKKENIHAVFQTIHVNMFDFGTDFVGIWCIQFLMVLFGI